MEMTALNMLMEMTARVLDGTHVAGLGASMSMSMSMPGAAVVFD